MNFIDYEIMLLETALELIDEEPLLSKIKYELSLLIEAKELIA